MFSSCHEALETQKRGHGMRWAPIRPAWPFLARALFLYVVMHMHFLVSVRSHIQHR